MYWAVARLAVLLPVNNRIYLKKRIYLKPDAELARLISLWIILWQAQMHALIQTVAFRGIDSTPVNVQVHIANGLPAIAVIGLADKAVAESRERVRAALSSIGLALPPKRVAVNLAPADWVSLLNHLKGVQILTPPQAKYRSAVPHYPDMRDLKG